MISNCKFQISNSRGFTIIEVLIAIAILAVIFSLGLFISWDFYRGFAFLSEQRVAVSVLQKARNQAMSNINQKTHGVYVDPGCYIIFKETYDNSGCNGSTNEVIKISPAVTVSGIQQVIFSQLSGNATVTGGNLTLSSNGKNAVITIHANGQIDVQ